jgi:hypothetical protein
VEAGAEIHTKGIENIFNESTVENFPKTLKFRRHLEPQIDMTRKEPLHDTA